MSFTSIFLSRTLCSGFSLLLLPLLFAVEVLAQAPVITSRPLSKVALAGQPVSFTVAATGGAPLTYQWKRNALPISGATNSTLALSNLTTSDRGFYQVTVTNASGTVSSVVMLNVVVPDSTVGGWPMLKGPPGLIANAVEVATGDGRNVALKLDGTVVTWDDNATAFSSPPVGLANIVGIAAGGAHYVAVSATGTVTAWGSNVMGQATVPAGLSNVVAVSAGTNHCMALRADGTVVAWGDNAHQQATVPTSVTDAVLISSGANHNIVLRGDGWFVDWGESGNGVRTGVNAVGIAAGRGHSLTRLRDGSIYGIEYNYSYGAGASPVGATSLAAIAAGEYHSLALKSDGSLLAWGLNTAGQASVPPGVANVRAIAAGGGGNLVLMPNVPPAIVVPPQGQAVTAGTRVTLSANVMGVPPLIFQWKRNGSVLADGEGLSGVSTSTLVIENAIVGASGDYTLTITSATGTITTTAVALTVNTPPTITARPRSRLVSIGQPVTFSVVATDSGQVTYQWRRNGQDIVGATATDFSISSAALSDRGHYEVVVRNATAVARSVFALNVVPGATTAPIVVSWGAAPSYSSSAFVPAALGNVVAISAGPGVAAALRSDGTVAIWGNAESRLLEIPVGLNDAVAIGMGSSHAVVLRADGTVITWGGTFQWTPQVPPGLRDVVAISTAYSSNIALKSDGTVVCWEGSGATIASPVGLSEVVAAAAGGIGFTALKRDGTVVSWSATSLTNSAPAGLAGVVAIAAGLHHRLALKADGTVVGWGGSDQGQLDIPAELSGVFAIGAGFTHSFAVKSDGAVVTWGRFRLGHSVMPPVRVVNGMAVAGGEFFSVALAGASAPAIATQPAGHTVTIGEAFTLSVNATGVPLPSFQWKKSGVAISGETGATLTRSAAQFSDAGDYTVTVTNSLDAVTSAVATMAVVAPPTITQRPLSRRVNVGGAVSFTVGATDSSALTYQWKRNGTTIAGATNSTLNLSNVTRSDDGYYQVGITNAVGGVASSYFRVFVSIADGAVIGWGSYSLGPTVSAPSTLRGLTAVAAGDSHGLALKSDGTVVAWGANNLDGQLSVPAGLNNVIAISATGNANMALKADGTVVAWPGSFAALASLTDVVMIDAGGACVRADGTLVMLVTSSSYLFGVPANLGKIVDVELGPTHALAIKPDGTLMGWGQANNGVLVFPADLGPVRAVAAHSSLSVALRANGSVSMWGLSSEVPAGLSNVLAIDAGIAFSLALKADGTVVSWGGNGAIQGAMPAGLSNVADIAAGANFALALMPAAPPTIATPPVTQPTAVGGTANFSVGAAGTVPFSYQWHFDSRPIAGATKASFSVANAQLANSGEYFVVVTNAFGTVASTPVSLTGVNPLPVIATQPQTQTVVAGQNVTLAVEVSALGAMSYQWRFDGVPLPGATGATFNLGPGAMSLSGRYDVVVTDGLSRSQSQPAVIVVTPTAYPQIVSVDPAIRPGFEVGEGYVGNFFRLPDGKLLVVGSFSRLHGALARNVGRLQPDSSPDPTFVGTAIDGPVYAVHVQADGRIIIGGVFRSVGGQPRDGLARLNANGTLDPAFVPKSDRFGTYAIAVQTDGKVVIGGAFSGYLARVNSDGSSDAGFAPAPNGTVNALVVLADGRLLVAGAFTSIAGVGSGRIACLDANGSIDATFLASGAFNNVVYALRMMADGRMVVGGAFTTHNGLPANRIIRLLPNGSADGSWSTGTGFNSSVYGLDLRSDGQVLAAGVFGGFNGFPMTAVARLLSSGARDSTFSSVNFDEAAEAVIALNNGRILVGGGFTETTFSGTHQAGIMLMENNGDFNFTYAPGLHQPSSVTKFVRLADGRIIAGGPFIYANSVRAPYLARLNTDSSFDPNFASNSIGRPNLDVDDVLIRADGKVVIVGAFGSYRGTAINGIARINADGSLDAAFRPGDLLGDLKPARIYALPTGRLLVLGKRAPAVFGESRRSDTLAIVNPDGTLDSAFASTRLTAGEILSVVVQPDGKIVVAGTFHSFNGLPCERVVRLLPSGAIDTTFSARVDAAIHAMALQPDGRILIAGDFFTVNSVPRKRVARLNVDGALDNVFVPQFELNAAANLLHLQPDGRIFVGGDFNSVSGHPVLRHLIRVQSTGALDTSFAPPGLSAALKEVVLAEDGSLWLGGGDIVLGGVARPGLLKTISAAGPQIISEPASQSLAAGAPLVVSAGVAGGEGVTYQWLRNGAAIAGATNPVLAVASATPADSGTYLVQITHGAGLLISRAASIVVTPSGPILAADAITGFGGAIKNGSRWALTAPALAAGTTPISYQWSKNSVALAGATARTLLLPSWQPADGGAYQVTVSNSVGAVASEPFVQHVTPTPDWDWRTPNPQGNSLFAMAYLNGRFIGTGARGTIITSTDGTAWSITRLGVSNTILDVVFGGDTYVARSSFGDVWTSTDASTWTQRDSGIGRDGRYFSALAFGAGQFVAVGNNGLIATSTNGATWALVSAGVTDTLGAIAFGGGRFVALGTQGRTYVSLDGASWTAGTFLPRPVTSIAHGAGRFVAATANQIFSSTDGLNWSQKTLETTASITALQFTDVGFLAALDSTNGKYWRSADGVGWAEQSTGLTLKAAATAIAHGAGRYVMVGVAPETLITAADAATWTRITAAESLNLAAVAASPSQLVAVGSSGATRVGSNGAVSFQPFYVEDYNRLADITYGASRFVAVFSAGNIWNSTDGVTWTSQSNSSHSYSGVSFANNRFLVLGTNGLMLTSLTGTNASWQTLNTGTSQTLLKTAYGVGVYVTVGENGALLRSLDGATWTPRDPNGIFSNINDVVFAGGKFVLVSEGGSIRTSADGLAWTAQANPLGAPLKSVVYAGGRFWAFTSGNTNYLTSTDAVVWTPAQHGNANATADAVEFNGHMYLVAANGAITSMILNATAPTIFSAPEAQTVFSSTPASFSINVSGTAPLFYQWFRNGVPVVGATRATLTLTNVAAADAGTYTVMVTNAAGSVTSGGAILTINILPPGLIASQARAITGAVALRGAFTVEGPVSKLMLIRAVGPTLGNLSVTGFLADPTLTIASTATETEFAANNDWESATNAAQAASVAAQLGAYPLLGGSKDAAVLASFPPGTYRVTVGPVGDVGIASLEIYDASAAPRLVYVATRAHMGAAGSFAQGVTLLAPPAGRTYLIRALGPSMGLTSALADPELRVFSGETQLAVNDNWGGSAALINLANNVGAMPIPPASKDAALSFTPTASGAYTLQVAGVGGTTGTALLEVFESDAQRAATVPVAVVSLPNNLSGTAGQTAKFGVVAVGKPAPTFQWSRNASPIAGAVSSTFVIPSAQVGDAGTYSVRVSNGGASVYTASATLAITAANNATHGIVGRGYVAGSIVTLTTTLHFVGAPAALNWNVELPANWSFASDTSTANNKPSTGATGTLSWSWTTPPASPLTFTYTLNVPTGEMAARALTSTFLVGGAAALVVPAPLTVGPKPPFHSADTDGDYALSLFELTRVIELYNTRNGTVRTGAYRVDASNLEDGFGADPTRVTAPASALVQYHSADTRGATTGAPRDGMIDLFELTRVIELYNTRAGTVRTGRYRVQADTEDGFAAGP